MVISGLQSGGSSWQQATLPNTLVVFSFVMNIGSVSEIDKPNNSIRWVSAGHEPGMIYDPAKDSFSDLNGGNNLALGVFENSDFKEAQREVAPGQIIVIATDGIWEARNPKGEMFSKDRIHKIIRRNATKSANDIQNSVLDALKRFQKDVKLEDDMTLVVIKITR
jgi:sigma-B regulation protein RsbU (phosphoserine phosphatase)